MHMFSCIDIHMLIHVNAVRSVYLCALWYIYSYIQTCICLSIVHMHGHSCLHTYMHTCAHACAHVYAFVHMSTCRSRIAYLSAYLLLEHVYMSTCFCIEMHAYAFKHAYAHICTHMESYLHICIFVVRVQMHTCAHVCAQLHIHTHPRLGSGV